MKAQQQTCWLIDETKALGQHAGTEVSKKTQVHIYAGPFLGGVCIAFFHFPSLVQKHSYSN